MPNLTIAFIFVIDSILETALRKVSSGGVGLSSGGGLSIMIMPMMLSYCAMIIKLYKLNPLICKSMSVGMACTLHLNPRHFCKAETNLYLN